MKSAVKICLFVILTSLVLSCTGGAKIYEIIFDPSIKDYTPVVSEIISSHPDGNFTLKFSQGVYPFYPEKAEMHYVAVSNNDNSRKALAFNLSDMKNVSIQGDSTLLKFYGSVLPFYIHNTEHVSLEGFSVTYDHPFVLEAEVVASDKVHRTFDIRIHPENDYSVTEGVFQYHGYDWSIGLGENIYFNPKTRSPYYSTEKYETNPNAALMAEDLGNRIVRISGSTARLMPPVGAILVDKGPHSKNRLYPCFAIQGSSDITIQNITVHDSGAMALIAENSEDISLKNYSTKVREGSGRMISASADATHFVNCRGNLLIEGCTFESMLDDAVNIHGTFMKVNKIISPHSFRASFGHFQQEGFDFAKAGDKLAFVDRTSLETISFAKVTDMQLINENLYEISVDQDITAMDGRTVAVDNLTRQVARTVISGCKVAHNRARSLLISTPGEVLIENCDFASMMAGIRICGDANYWFESGQTSDIVIRNNVFRDLSNGGWAPQAVLQIDPVIPHAARSNDRYYHRSVTFEGNLVSSFEDQLVYALSVDTLVIRNNRFVDSKTFPVRYPDLSVIDVQFCNHVIIKDNDFTEWKENASISSVSCNYLDFDSALPVIENPNRFFFQN